VEIKPCPVLFIKIFVSCNSQNTARDGDRWHCAHLDNQKDFSSVYSFKSGFHFIAGVARNFFGAFLIPFAAYWLYTGSAWQLSMTI
jgi:hypothetical protein